MHEDCNQDLWCCNIVWSNDKRRFLRTIKWDMDTYSVAIVNGVRCYILYAHDYILVLW